MKRLYVTMLDENRPNYDLPPGSYHSTSGLIYLPDDTKDPTDPNRFIQDHLFISELPASRWEGLGGRWHLLLERDEFISNDLAKLEKRLGDWAKGESFVDGWPQDGFGPLPEDAQPKSLISVQGRLHPVTFALDGPDTFPGYTDGTQWNGFDNIWFHKDHLDAVLKSLAVAAMLDRPGPYSDWPEDVKDEVFSGINKLEPDVDGLICLAYGYCTQTIEDDRGSSDAAIAVLQAWKDADEIDHDDEMHFHTMRMLKERRDSLLAKLSSKDTGS